MKTIQYFDFPNRVNLTKEHFITFARYLIEMLKEYDQFCSFIEKQKFKRKMLNLTPGRYRQITIGFYKKKFNITKKSEINRILFSLPYNDTRYSLFHLNPFIRYWYHSIDLLDYYKLDILKTKVYPKIPVIQYLQQEAKNKYTTAGYVPCVIYGDFSSGQKK